MLSAILLPKTFVITLNGQSYTILRTDSGFQELYDAYKSNNTEIIQQLLQQYGYLRSVIEQVQEQIDQLNPDAVQNDDELWNEEDQQEEVDAVNAGDDEDDDQVSSGEPDESFPEPGESAPVAATRPEKVRNEKYLRLDVGDNGELIINGVTFENTLTQKIAKLFYEGHDIKSYYELLRKIAENPSHVIRSGLLDFILVNDLPITTDGCFLAYKVTHSDGYDMHSRTIKYEVGKVIEEPRESVSTDRGECSGKGLYFASKEYYGSVSAYEQSESRKRFLMKVDPADVIAIPHTYRHSKGRCCRFTVAAEIGWDPANLPVSSGIVDAATLKNVPGSARRAEQAANTKPVIGGTQNLIEQPIEGESKPNEKLFAKIDKKGRYRTLKGHFIKAEDLHLFTILNAPVKPLAKKDRNGRWRNAKGHMISKENLSKYTLEE